MKPKLTTFFTLLLIGIFEGILCTVAISCKNPQATALNTLATAEQSTTAAYDSYLALVIKGSIPTNDVPKFSHLYNQFQADMIIAIVAVQGNTNATAPANILSESTSLINQLTPLTTGK